MAQVVQFRQVTCALIVVPAYEVNQQLHGLGYAHELPLCI